MNDRTSPPEVNADGLSIERRAALYDHMLEVAKANGFSSLTEAITARSDLKNAPHVMRRIRRCENETAAQVVLEHFGNEQRRAALEEAAKVCDEKQDWYEKDRCIGQATAVGACADEIRALAKEGE
ncbi:hypothetical protein [Paraburkholderia terrae]|uniref:hypothetical protein n=1 Tax=Paraburkholderia terrae TaxID=311230 RepID=UPI001EE2C866|nr:hypothetical protein [Paraburkholderia terrae]GJH00230.1 hypothetical protein CBA19C8_06755 [Paraburkholderia terrae]